MLKNEKYKGDSLFQKTFTEDYLNGIRRKNEGQRPKYYVKDSHPAIISPRFLTSTGGNVSESKISTG